MKSVPKLVTNLRGLSMDYFPIPTSKIFSLKYFQFKETAL